MLGLMFVLLLTYLYVKLMSGDRGNFPDCERELFAVGFPTCRHGECLFSYVRLKTLWLRVLVLLTVFPIILDFAELVHFILVSDHELLNSYPHH